MVKKLSVTVFYQFVCSNQKVYNHNSKFHYNKIENTHFIVKPNIWTPVFVVSIAVWRIHVICMSNISVVNLNNWHNKKLLDILHLVVDSFHSRRTYFNCLQKHLYNTIIFYLQMSLITFWASWLKLSLITSVKLISFSIT